MTHDEFRFKWRKEADAFRKRHTFVEAAALCDEILQDFDAMMLSEMKEVLNLRQAAAESGYSPDHLGALIRQGKLPNAGRRNAPKLRRGDLPLKPSRARSASRTDLAGLVSRIQIARALVSRVI